MHANWKAPVGRQRMQRSGWDNHNYRAERAEAERGAENHLFLWCATQQHTCARTHAYTLTSGSQQSGRRGSQHHSLWDPVNQREEGGEHEDRHAAPFCNRNLLNIHWHVVFTSIIMALSLCNEGKGHAHGFTGSLFFNFLAQTKLAYALFMKCFYHKLTQAAIFFKMWT